MSPADEAEVAQAVKQAAADRTPLEIMGGGSRRGLGRPAQAGRTLSMAGLSGITLYEPGALTLVARSGTPLAEIETALAAERQMLSFEPMDHRPIYGLSEAGPTPTIGGVVAVGASGPRRVQAGACRDSLIGVRFVNGAGEAVSSGGRVMKNVTGYDLVKLMAGAFGELGVLTELSFKLSPRPEIAATLRLYRLEDARAVAAMTSALGSPFNVSAAAHAPATLDGEAVTLLRLEGFADSVAYRAGALRDRLAEFGEVEINDDPMDGAAVWSEVRDVAPFAGREGALWRIAVRPSRAAQLVAVISTHREALAYYDWGGGLIWLMTPEDDMAGARILRAESAKIGADAVLVRASDAVRAAAPTFPPQPEAVAALARGLKAKFDPYGVLNPGRMTP
ncbi:MAG: glycolate oxidase subunit GlcE [Rhodobacteraceae bacterium]|nr:glycolate oxidase subunit GlcE [Paracoccaceae bacterium]